MFDSLNSFLPQFKSSCEEVQREFAETGTTHYSVEELVTDSDEESISSNETDSSDAMAGGASVPTVEMVFLFVLFYSSDWQLRRWKLSRRSKKPKTR